MKILLDTQAFLFLANKDASLGKKAAACYLKEDNEIFLSVVSVWEMQIKLGLGKLKVSEPLRVILRQATEEAGIRLLTLELEHILALEGLPPHHRDPFDRLLISQAQTEGMAILSGDSLFDRYGVKRIW